MSPSIPRRVFIFIKVVGDVYENLVEEEPNVLRGVSKGRLFPSSVS